MSKPLNIYLFIFIFLLGETCLPHWVERASQLHCLPVSFAVGFFCPPHPTSTHPYIHESGRMRVEAADVSHANRMSRTLRLRFYSHHYGSTDPTRKSVNWAQPAQRGHAVVSVKSYVFSRYFQGDAGGIRHAGSCVCRRLYFW